MLYSKQQHAKHNLPVIPVIIYAFPSKDKTEHPQLPPYEITCAGKTILSLHYEVICLWEIDAEPVVKEHLIALYTLLPAMKEPREDLLKSAIEEMAEHYTHTQLGYHFMWFRRMMQRTQTMTIELDVPPRSGNFLCP